MMNLTLTDVVSSAKLPFLNAIGKFWSKIKAGIRRNALAVDDRLSASICEFVQMVTRAERTVDLWDWLILRVCL
jgi:hypothetical protein